MAKTGYQAVALDPAVAKQLRGVAHYLSMTSGERHTLSDAVDMLVAYWAHGLGLPPELVAIITGAPQPAGQVTLDDAQR